MTDAAVPGGLLDRDFAPFVHDDQSGQSHSLTLLVEGVHCANCIGRIERTLTAEPGVTEARVNLTTGRLNLTWQGNRDRINQLAAMVEGLGYPVAPFDQADPLEHDQAHEKSLLRALAVAGFGAANIMLMSVAMWSGAADKDATRLLFNLLSAVIAVPVTAYAGMPFFKSAWGVLKNRGTNMDVPISLAVILAVGLSLVQITQGEAHVWFESATMLLFFLLIGRLLDTRARGKARSTVSRLLALRHESAHVIGDDGTINIAPADQVEPGMRLMVPAGAKIPVDGTIDTGTTELDCSLITGERTPRMVEQGDKIHAGTINLGSPVTMTATLVKDDTLLAEITRLMELAEQKRGRIVVLADKIARAYVPVVHALALLSLTFWLTLGNASLTQALEITIAVLVITCPCALALAVPVVQVLSSTQLMKAGLFIKSPTALERLAEVDMIAFDKTGTLTEPMPVPDTSGLNDRAKSVAAGLAASSMHPLARSLAAALSAVSPATTPPKDVMEVPGAGMSAMLPDGEAKLGRWDWVGGTSPGDDPRPRLWLKLPDEAPQLIPFEDMLRPDAGRTIKTLKQSGYELALLSGDHMQAVRRIADEIEIDDWHAAIRPKDKLSWLEDAQASGYRIMMVGDGLNDGPALAGAHVSLSPSTATDLAQNAADVVFQGKSLLAITRLLTVAKKSAALARQNITFAICYNVVAVPLAMAGEVTPMIAALAMSASSIIVTLNSFRIAREVK